MNLKWLHFADVAEIQVAVINELKKAQKEEFRQLFRNCMTPQKPVFISMNFILNKNKAYVFIVRLRFLKISVLKLLDSSLFLMRAAGQILFSICVG